ncbi:DUF998 domain-containing protein [Actinoplanes sp. URMC 104]|uniref:DUF998 domain-containing protein n=1 Tax=Actinoplanes sp. URMC 104 TaxID=3423409 RepID=UPI003F1C0AE4
MAAPLFLAANIVVGLAWDHPRFSWATNNVSDLGNVHCGIWDTTRPRYVCSPWHDSMNAAFVLTAALLIAGLFLARRTWGAGRAGWWLMLLGAAGLGLVGAFPADVNENVHLLAALLVFAAGNLGLLLAAFPRRTTWPTHLRTAALLSGAAGLIGGALFLAQQDLGIGPGGMERVAVFPLTLWATYAGATHLVQRHRSGHRPEPTIPPRSAGR